LCVDVKVAQYINQVQETISKIDLSSNGWHATSCGAAVHHRFRS
jgi:hypothetical protein